MSDGKLPLARTGTAQAGIAENELTADSLRNEASRQYPTGDAGRFDQHADRPTLAVLVVDDDAPVRHACAEIARSMGFLVTEACDVDEAREKLASGQTDLLLLDLRLPGGGGLALLETVRSTHPGTTVVVMTAFATVKSAVEAMRIGASDYLTKPFTLDELSAVLEAAAQRRSFDHESRALREQLRTGKGMGSLVGRSPAMEKLYRILSKVAYTSHPVLILGESGTGKELIARLIHSNGPSASKPFIPVDCGSLVPTLIESELFGHVKGAFTGANRAKTGLLVAADHGTVFLDEIGELPLDLQAKLLRALQEREVRPVGATHSLPISARIVAATNRDLTQMVEQGKFRKDLYFRLNVVNIRVPPLRERKTDIPLLAAHVLERMHRENGIRYTFSDDTLRLLMEYDWPGNVRELEHAIERACALSSGPVLHMGDFPTQLQDHRFHIIRGAGSRDATAPGHAGPAGSYALDDDPPPVQSIAEMEKQAILNTIRQLKGDKLMAAKLLGIGKTTLYRKLKEYGLGDETSLG
ncbi:MAG: sigma-54 dependent transcriptional regulator [Acidobacteriaceae bacterium]|nr:sigma-54 dependent transcriptional regulator [Acidobacteriaceae bacterium]